jgi:DnaJ-class molecular chaperone
MVTCPCCHGEKVLFLFEQERTGQKFPREPMKHDCTHCQGKGEVPAEVSELPEFFTFRGPSNTGTIE